MQKCNQEKITNSASILEFTIKLCELIECKRYGDPIIVKFGERPEIAGYSLVQLIETSCLTGHFVDNDSSVYIDIFSCNEYDAKLAVEFTVQYFESVDYRYSVLSRK